MTRSAVMLALVGAFVASPTAAQDMTLEQVLERHYEAIGGVEAWKNFGSMKAVGTFALPAQGIEAPFTMVQKRPNKLRLEFTLQGMTGVQAYDGETAWMRMPFMTGKDEPERMPDGMAAELKEDADIDGPLIGYEQEGHQLELVGLEETEGTQAYKIKVTRQSGSVIHYFLDAEYYIPIKVEGTRMQMGQEVQFAQILSDYKEVDGLLLPHSIASQPGPVITIESYQINVPVADSTFVMPAASACRDASVSIFPSASSPVARAASTHRCRA